MIYLLKRLVLVLAVFLGSPIQAAIKYPIVFVTQVPIPEDYCTLNSTFCNHQADLRRTGRGGDLWIRYTDGTLKNLTAAAGFGQVGLQGTRSIQVRDPAVHWNGKKIIFSMVRGSPQKRYKLIKYYWQLYEMTGLAKNQKPVITKVAKQATNYNNINPTYGTDGRIIFVSDRPRDGLAHLYPQLDEYESEPSNTGLWSLNPATGALFMLTHSPSGDFNPFVDSYGRVIFTRWDHLQQDQKASGDRNGTSNYGTFNYASEASIAKILNSRQEVFPEPLPFDAVSLAGTQLSGIYFNHFFPWQVNEDGTNLETVNHIGRHELGGSYSDRVFTKDFDLVNSNVSSVIKTQKIKNFFQIKQDPTNPNIFIGVDAPDFESHASGQIIRLSNTSPSHNANQMVINYLTAKSTATNVGEGANVPSCHSGHYRDPVILSDGTLLAAHTFETHQDKEIGVVSTFDRNSYPKSRYAFRLRTLKKQPNGIWKADKLLTSGIKKKISYFDPNDLVQYADEMWELQPVEVRARTKPAKLQPSLAAPEKQVLKDLAISEASLRLYLAKRNLALAIVRNVTRRDDKDKQQPFNLAVAGSSTKTVTGKGKVYQVAHFQVFQADQIRGSKGCCSATAKPGRRVLAQPLHSVNANFPLAAGAPKGSVKIAKDGSVAILLPTRRAVTWQLTDKKGNFVVRERNWVSMQPGEIHSCPTCHGVNATDQVGNRPPTNKPQALRDLLVYLKKKGLK